MTLNIYQEKLQDIRYKKIGRKQDQKADLFIGLWLELKIAVTQSKSVRAIRKQEKSLDKFFSNRIILEMLEQNEMEAQKEIYREIYDSAIKYQQACLDDRGYGSKLFNLVRMKQDEIATKAGREVYQIIIPSLFEMEQKIWRDQMIVAIHLAHQKIFAESTVNAEYYFEDQQKDLLEKLNATVKNVEIFDEEA